jgi:phosphoglycerate dehydrogenase-like enzyme
MTDARHLREGPPCGRRETHTMTKQVLVLDDYQKVALQSADWSRLEGRAEVHVHHEHLASEADVIEALQDYDAVVAMRERTAFPRRVLDRLPRLRLLVTTGPSNAAIDLAAAQDNGVVVCGTRGAFPAPAELTWALIHALTRNIVQEDRALRDGTWQTTIGTELAGRTLGIVGLGRLGQRVARVAHAFDMNVVAWSENLTAEQAAESGATLVGKDELFASSDVVTVQLQLSERTAGLIGAHELGLMRPTAYLVNTSRGPIVDETALVEALRSGSIAGAGLDVFDQEPLPADHPLRYLPNTVLTPHIGYVARDLYAIFYADAVDDVDNWLSGTPIRVIS